MYQADAFSHVFAIHERIVSGRSLALGGGTGTYLESFCLDIGDDQRKQLSLADVFGTSETRVYKLARSRGRHSISPKGR